MSSCVKPKEQKEANPVVLLHGFDRYASCYPNSIDHFLLLCSAVHYTSLFSTCLEWRYTLPLLEEAGLETWAVDILGWGFSDLGILFCSSTFAIFIFQKDFANKDSGFAHSFIPLCFLVIFKEGFLRVM